MKTNNILYALIIGFAFTSSLHSAFAMERGEGGPRLTRIDRESHATSKPEMVKWAGEVRDDAASHTNDHEHALTFLNKEDGKIYDVVDSPALVKLHHETEKSFLVEVEAEKTPRFLFWGANLIVKNFRVISELGESVPHNEARARAVRQNIGNRR